MTYDLNMFDKDVFEDVRMIMQSNFTDLIEGYFSDSFMYFEKIKHGFEQGNAEVIAQYAQPLHSASAGVGAVSVSFLAKDLERYAKEIQGEVGDFKSMEMLLPPLSDALKHAKEKLQSEL